jgi:hypothetical protein
MRAKSGEMVRKLPDCCRGWLQMAVTRRIKTEPMACRNSAEPRRSHGWVLANGLCGGNDRARTFHLFRRWYSSSLLGLLLLMAAVGAGAQAPQPSEYQLKAAFLFNFAKFVEWPPEAFAEPGAPFIIGVLGDNPFGGELERTIQGKSINGRPLKVKEFASLAEAKGCQILFVSNSETKRLPAIFSGLQGSNVLTVGESAPFAENGGMINFVLENNKIRFQINDQAARNAGLKISSKLLSLAVRPAR